MFKDNTFSLNINSLEYTIRDLEKLSGVQAHTIRIWEQRYNLLLPNRTDTNIRSYSDYYARKLLNVITLINNGWKISKVAKLNHDQINAEIQKIIETHDADGDVDISIVNQIIESGVTLSEAAFEKAFLSALVKYGIKDSYLKVIYPVLVKVGLMWNKDDIVPVQEHFITSMIKQKLFAAIDGLPHTYSKTEKWVLFLPEGEHHEIGLLMACYLLKEKGLKVMYLGPNIAISDLNEVMVKGGVSHLLMFAVSRQTISIISEVISQIKEVSGKSKLLVAGSFPKEVTSVKVQNVSFVHSFSDFIKQN